MKRAVAFALLAALVMSLLPMAALASYDHDVAHGDMVVKGVKAYRDPEMTDYIGTIPKYTAVVVKDTLNGNWYTANKAALVTYKGVKCYIKTSALLQDEYPGSAKEVTLKKSVRVYQRPTSESANVKAKKGTKVLYIGKKGSWALIRTDALDNCGDYGFVYIG